MKLLTASRESSLTRKSSQLACISIIASFEPKMAPVQQLKSHLKKLQDSVENELLLSYGVEKAMPVLENLQGLISHLDYTTHRKSVAIFVSAETSRVLYPDFEVEEKVVIGENFGIRDLMMCRKEDGRHLVLVLGATYSSIYLGDDGKLQKLCLNKAESIASFVNDVPERVGNFSDPSEREEVLQTKFLHHIDNSMAIILQAYRLPLFVIGGRRLGGHFMKITRNRQYIVSLIHGSYAEAPEHILQGLLQPYLENWKAIRQSYLSQELERARDARKLSWGLEAVSYAVTHKNSRLLLLEKNYCYSVDSDLFQEATEGCSKKKPFYIGDEADMLIEKVLEYGGDVEFADEALLTSYDHIALIQYY